jgi:myo-inositol 2-dehydrogenase / D-chiro-inositol 1-dehydrogenase
MGATRTSTLRIGVIGVGRIGRMHADLLARQVPGAGVGFVHDARLDAAREVAGELGVAVAADIDELLGAAEIDAVAICTSTGTHADLITAAARAGKAIFCEKPVSLDLAEVDRALAAVDEAGVPFQIGFNRRFDPTHATVAAAVADGTIGDPHLVRITSRDPAPPPMDYVRTSGGIFLDMTIHDFDMARYVTGSEVVEVFARGAVRVDPAFAEAGDVDTAVVTLVHESGCLTTIDNSRQAVYGYDQRVEVFGSAGMAASENPLAHGAIVRTGEGTRAATLPYFYLERYIPSYVREWQAFVAAVTEGQTPAVTGPDARAPLVIGLAAGRSLREGRPVRLEEVDAPPSARPPGAQPQGGGTPWA